MAQILSRRELNRATLARQLYSEQDRPGPAILDR